MRLPERIERWLQPVVITLDLHLVHHSVAHNEANANFGAVLSVWDRLFGTYRRLPRAALDRHATLLRVHDRVSSRPEPTTGNRGAARYFTPVSLPPVRSRRGGAATVS